MKTLKSIKVALAIVGLLLLIIIGISTVNVLSITENPAFKIDFKNKHQIIGGYAALIGAILSFLSIVFVLYNIILQNHQYEDEKKVKEKNESDLLFNRLLLVDNLLNEITSHIVNTGEEMDKFTKDERKKPLISNFLNSYSSKQFYRLLELDYNSIYKAFFEFLPSEGEKHFNNLYSITDFYSEALPELRENVKNHLSYKYNRRLKVMDNVNNILDLISGVLKHFKETIPETYQENELFNLFNNLMASYTVLVRRNEAEKEETDFKELSNDIFLPFLEDYLKLDIQLKSSDAEVVANKISSVRKDIHSIEVEGLHMADQVESSQKKYFSKTSKQIEKINGIQNEIKLAIRARKIQQLEAK